MIRYFEVSLKITFVNPPIADQITGGPALHFSELNRHLVARGFRTAVMRKNRPSSAFLWFPDTPTGAIRASLWSDVIYFRFRPTSNEPGSFSRSISWLQKIRKLPLVWEINAPIYEGVILNKFDPVECGKRTSIATKFADSVDLAYCVSREIQGYAQKTLGIEKAIYVPNGSDCERFTPEISKTCQLLRKDGETIVFWMGSGVLPWEGSRLIVELARRIYATTPNIRFVLAGGGKDLLPELPPNLTHLGKVSHEILPQHLAAADICLCLYDLEAYGEFKFYNSPLKLYEYMASGKAIIGSDAGEISRTLTHMQNGFLVGTDLAEAHKAICVLANDRKLRCELGRNARLAAEQYYNWDRVARQTAESLEETYAR